MDTSLLHDWLEEDADHKPFKDTAPFPDDRFRLSKKHINRAIRHSNNSAPGPDGIPFLAWRRAKDLSTQILYDAAQVMFSETGPDATAADYGYLNNSLLLFLPKKASGTTPTGEGYYEAANVRPLNVTNTDNRLLANAVRYVIEPFVGQRVTTLQRGFIGGRSMLANLVDIDEAMAYSTCVSDKGAAMFYDFAAAFPSEEHGFMMAVVRRLGWPN